MSVLKITFKFFNIMMLCLSNQTCFYLTLIFPFALCSRNIWESWKKEKSLFPLKLVLTYLICSSSLTKFELKQTLDRYMAKNVLYWKTKASFFYNPSLSWELNPVHLALLNYTCLSKYLITWLTFAVVFTQYNRCARATFITWKRMLDLLWVLC